MSDVASAALVTGVSRRIGIGWAIAGRLASDGFATTTAGWRPYDERMPWGSDAVGDDAAGPGGLGSAAMMPHFEVDLEDADVAAALIARIAADRGPLTALVLCHCESVDSDILGTTIESFDRHMAVNARATWQLVKAFAEQFQGPVGSGRIVSITSDHTAGNLPYGASKGAMDRIVLAAAVEFAERGITANVVNPGATDTGWMSPDIMAAVRVENLQPRVGLPSDVANLVSFLCSPRGQWINGQVLRSDGGRSRQAADPI